jgi:hypothetical protein
MRRWLSSEASAVAAGGQKASAYESLKHSFAVCQQRYSSLAELQNKYWKTGEIADIKRTQSHYAYVTGLIEKREFEKAAVWVEMMIINKEKSKAKQMLTCIVQTMIVRKKRKGLKYFF